jgi:hypothetical protein
MRTQDPLDSRLAHADAHSTELLLDPSLAPPTVLALQRDDQLDDLLVCGLAAAAASSAIERAEP